jgi:hypothetical protein
MCNLNLVDIGQQAIGDMAKARAARDFRRAIMAAHGDLAAPGRPIPADADFCRL